MELKLNRCAAPPEFDEEAAPDLGPCCICGGALGVRNVMMLGVKNQVPGHGWGCVVCHLPPDGASAVLCDACLGLFSAGKAEIKFAARGYPATEGRVPIEALSVPHEHDPLIDHDA
jgi:hypothetical protein